jgi:hypothetical protein
MNSPIGPKVPVKPPPQKPEWTPVPGKPHLEQNAKGEWRTAAVPLPPKQ